MKHFLLLFSILPLVSFAFKLQDHLFFSGPLPDSQKGFESICNGTDHSNEAKCFLKKEAQAYKKSNAALRIKKRGYAHCTGWIVGDKGHILTNYHCVGSQREADSLEFEAMAEGSSCDTNCQSSGACAGSVIHKKPLKFLKSGGSIEEDYTLLQLQDTEDIKEIIDKYGFLQLRRSGPVKGERIYIPQHPRGWGKRIAMTDGKDHAVIAGVDIPDFNRCGKGQVAYIADTQGGSSGSPVLGYKDHAVIAIHHCGGCSTYANTGVTVTKIIDGVGDLLPKSAFSDPISD